MRYTPQVVLAVVCSIVLLGAMFNARPASAVAPANNNLAAATSITALPYSTSPQVDTTEATRQTGEPQ